MVAVATSLPQAVGDERWICKHCAYTALASPGGEFHEKKCPDCGGKDWHYTVAPEPRV